MLILLMLSIKFLVFPTLLNRLKLACLYTIILQYNLNMKRFICQINMLFFNIIHIILALMVIKCIGIIITVVARIIMTKTVLSRTIYLDVTGIRDLMIILHIVFMCFNQDSLYFIIISKYNLLRILLFLLFRNLTYFK